MKLTALLIGLALIASLPALGQKRRVKTRIKVIETELLPGDIVINKEQKDSTVAYLVGQVEISDYQKPAGSDKETFSITNNTDKTLTAVELQLEYLTPEGQQIHKRKAKVSCEVPPGETRVAELRSWDRQCSWYFLHGQKPRKLARPYEVKLEIESIHLSIN